MAQEIIITAGTVEGAIEEALGQLGVSREDVEIEIIEEPTKRFFGDPTDAKVRVSLLVEAGEEDSTDDAAEDEAEDDAPEGDDALADEADSDDDGDELEDTSLAEQERNFNEAAVELSEEELDIIADNAIEVTRGFLAYFGLEDAEIDEYEGDEGELIFDIVGDNLAVLIGRHGKTLDSFQFLVSSIVGKRTGYRHPVIIDVEGYKHRRKQKLVSIAKSSAARAIRQKHAVDLRPMSPYERRIIHVALKNDKRIVTSSEGAEPSRYVVIRPA
jgi:spoIIIJ-associated protein